MREIQEPIQPGEDASYPASVPTLKRDEEPTRQAGRHPDGAPAIESWHQEAYRSGEAMYEVVQAQTDVTDKGLGMIRLTRINHKPLVLNADLIEHIETTPDTVISMTTGQKFVVQETADEIIDRIYTYRRAVGVRQGPVCGPAEVGQSR